MDKVAIIGIDGLDSNLLTKFGNNLPNFKKLIQKSPKIQMNSVFPPDSPTAWTSIYTGKNPAEHGIITFRDPFTTSKICEYLGSNISGKTFWDIAGNNGKKVCIVFPHLGYPVWPVNGVMVGRTTEVDIREFDIMTYPSNLLDEITNPLSLKPMSSYPLDIGDIVEPTKKLIFSEMDFGIKLFKGVPWDLFFIYFSSLDNIEHLFWMYFDKNDPEYKDGNPYNNVIPEMYEFYDEHVIGPFMQMIDSDTTLVVLSDHGHSMRPTKVVNINEALRQEGYLYSRIGSENNISYKYYSFEIIRKNLAKLISEYRLVGKLASKALRVYPKGLHLYTDSVPIDKERTIAYLSDPSGGLKSYSYAGIKIKKEDLDIQDYEAIRTRIINMLLKIEDPKSSERLIRWAIRREELYEGDFINKYPDVLFRLNDDWGVSWEMNSSLYGSSYSHKLHSGNHRQETAVFLLSKYENFPCKNAANLYDIAPTILDILDINGQYSFSGESIIK